MQWHLDYNPPKPGFSINHETGILLVGSCFSENIGQLLSDHKFKTFCNTGGILFNPKSIHTFLSNGITNSNFDKKYSLLRDGLYYSYLHHSSVNDQHYDVLRDKINAITSKTAEFLQTCKVLVITFGSAFVYEHKALQQVVANCHKQPAATFTKRLLSVREIVTNYSALINELQQLNPELQIIFTVSPVKYLKDGVVENNISKATLLLAVHELSQLAACSYFPAFELVNDDLRDYRFYKEDMAHPNEQAIAYVWEKFGACYFTEATKMLNTEIRKLNLAMNHRLMNNGSEEADRLNAFIAKQKQAIQKLNANIQF